MTTVLGYGHADSGQDRLRFWANYAADSKWLPAQLSIGFGVQRQQTLEGPAWGGELRTTMQW